MRSRLLSASENPASKPISMIVCISAVSSNESSTMIFVCSPSTLVQLTSYLMEAQYSYSLVCRQSNPFHGSSSLDQSQDSRPIHMPQSRQDPSCNNASVPLSKIKWYTRCWPLLRSPPFCHDSVICVCSPDFCNWSIEYLFYSEFFANEIFGNIRCVKHSN